MSGTDSMNKALKLIEDDASKILGLKFGERTVTKGEVIPKAEVASTPELSFRVPSETGKYIVVALDPDAPMPSFSIFGPILHWIQPGLTASGETLTSSEPFVANFIPPGPPPFSGPHRYVFILYEQPDGFVGKVHAPADGQPLGLMSRMRYNLDAWIEKAGLKAPVAANYFRSS